MGVIESMFILVNIMFGRVNVVCSCFLLPSQIDNYPGH